MKWSEDSPKVSGWYWFKSGQRTTPEVVLYDCNFHEQYYNDGDFDKVECVIGFWSDKPIEKPENNL